MRQYLFAHICSTVLVTVVSVLNQRIEHSVYLMCKYINHFIIALVHLLHHMLERTRVKDGIPGGIFRNTSGGCAIRLGLLIAYPDAKYGLIEDVIAIALTAYVDALVCRFVIIIVGMP